MDYHCWLPTYSNIYENDVGKWKINLTRAHILWNNTPVLYLNFAYKSLSSVLPLSRWSLYYYIIHHQLCHLFFHYPCNLQSSDPPRNHVLLFHAICFSYTLQYTEAYFHKGHDMKLTIGICEWAHRFIFYHSHPSTTLNAYIVFESQPILPFHHRNNFFFFLWHPAPSPLSVCVWICLFFSLNPALRLISFTIHVLGHCRVRCRACKLDRITSMLLV